MLQEHNGRRGQINKDRELWTKQAGNTNKHPNEEDRGKHTG